MIPMYSLWLDGLYGPRCPLSPERQLNLITHSLAYSDRIWNKRDIFLEYIKINKNKKQQKFQLQNEYWELVYVTNLKETTIYNFYNLANGLAPNRQQTIIWTNVDLKHLHIFVAPGGDDLNDCDINLYGGLGHCWFRKFCVPCFMPGHFPEPVLTCQLGS